MIRMIRCGLIVLSVPIILLLAVPLLIRHAGSGVPLKPGRQAVTCYGRNARWVGKGVRGRETMRKEA